AGVSGQPNRVQGIVSARHAEIVFRLLPRDALALVARERCTGDQTRFNRRSWGPSLNWRKSADYIIATNGGRLEGLFSDSRGVFTDLKSAEIRDDPGPAGTELFPSLHRRASVGPRPAFNSFQPLTPL